MAHCCPSSSFGTSRRGWSFWWGRRIRWRRLTTTKKKKKSMKTRGTRTGRRRRSGGPMESKYVESGENDEMWKGSIQAYCQLSTLWHVARSFSFTNDYDFSTDRRDGLTPLMHSRGSPQRTLIGPLKNWYGISAMYFFLVLTIVVLTSFPLTNLDRMILLCFYFAVHITHRFFFCADSVC